MYGYIFTIPGIIISTVTGLLSFDKDFNSSQNGPVITGSLNILTAILGTIYKVLKYGDYEGQFKFLCGEHLKLYEEIQATLLKSPLDRDNAHEFMRKIESRRIQLLDDAPVISKETMKGFKKKYKNSVRMPLLLNKINAIKIFGRDQVDSIISETSSVKTDIMSKGKDVIISVNDKTEKEVLKETSISSDV
jgi:hypothetical protein